jgi:ribosomal protein S25
MAHAKPEISTAELETLILDVVAREARPVTATEIHRAIPKALRPKAKAVSAIVAALAASQRLFRNGRRYAATRDRTLHDRIVRAVANEPLSSTELAKQLRVPASRVREAIRELAETAELHAHPKHRRIVRYSAHPPTPADRLRPHLSKLFADAAKLGLDERAATLALRELLGESTAVPERDPIVAAMLALNPQARSGALVYVPHLRTALADSFTDKPSFDRAVLGLLARGKVDLQSHPTPSLLGRAEREAMIEDGRGGYYSAIGLR